MSVEKQEFYGKEVTDAIREACDTLDVSQEMLDIEVLETGSMGIFGLIRKKAKIRVSVKTGSQAAAFAEETPADAVLKPQVAPEVEEQPRQDEPQPATTQPAADVAPAAPSAEKDTRKTDRGAVDDDQVDEDEEDDDLPGEGENDATEESLELVSQEVGRLVELMGFPSTVEVSAKGRSVSCDISGPFEEALIGPEGKTLDAIQYLVRKMVARKGQERLRIALNVGDFRQRRLEELKVRAVELARSVRENGRTQVLPALNPSERREIHMVLQEDKEVRSRSVGDGLFKKILIYKPGKSGKGGRQKGGGRSRRGKGGKSGNDGQS
ncbi:MAG: protein jag [Desulfopila sp.]